MLAVVNLIMPTPLVSKVEAEIEKYRKKFRILNVFEDIEQGGVRGAIEKAIGTKLNMEKKISVKADSKSLDTQLQKCRPNLSQTQ